MSFLRLFLYGPDYRPPAVSINVDIRPSVRPVPLQCERVTCRSKMAGQGRSDVGPKFQNLPVEVATEVDAHKTRKPSPEISNSGDLTLAWAMTKSRSSRTGISKRLAKLSAAIKESDPEFSGDLALLSGVAKLREDTL